MNDEQLAAVILTELKRQAELGLGQYLDESIGIKQVCLDGWFDLVALAAAIRKEIENGR